MNICSITKIADNLIGFKDQVILQGMIVPTERYVTTVETVKVANIDKAPVITIIVIILGFAILAYALLNFLIARNNKVNKQVLKKTLIVSVIAAILHICGLIVSLAEYTSTGGLVKMWICFVLGSVVQVLVIQNLKKIIAQRNMKRRRET